MSTTDTLLTILITIISLVIIITLIIVCAFVLFLRKILKKVNRLVDESGETIGLLRQRLLKNVGLYTTLRFLAKRAKYLL